MGVLPRVRFRRGRRDSQGATPRRGHPDVFHSPSLSAFRPNPERLSITSEAPSQIYLTGVGNRSYFDARSIYYLGLSGADQQSQIPVIHPVIDYNRTLDRPILGGQVRYDLNFTSLSRQQADFQANQSNHPSQTDHFRTAQPRLRFCLS